MEKLERKCCFVIVEGEQLGKNLYSYELKNEISKKIIEYRKDIDSVINEKIVVDSLKNVKDNYYTLLYLIIYENDLTYRYKEQLINALLDNVSKKRISPILSILMLNSTLNNDIVSRIIDITDEKYVDENHSYLGNKPFDYRYHILKREEVSNENIKKVLNRYESKDSYCIEDEEHQLYYDLQDEEFAGNANTKEYKDEERAYQLIKTIKNKR